MIIVEKNVGPKIPYTVSGKKICFDDDLTINLATRQKDNPVHIDVCYDEDHCLVIGTAAGRAYVAELDLPAMEYEEEGEGEEKHLVPKALDMTKVTLSLWAI